MSKDTLKEEIIAEIRKENGGTVFEVSSIVDFQFEYVRNTIRAGGYEGVRLPYFGKFYVKPLRVKLLTDETFRREREQGNSKHRAKVSSGI